MACLQQERESRMVSIRELTNGDAEASRWVGRPVIQMPADTILVPEELDQLRQHIRQMTDLRNQRIGQLGKTHSVVKFQSWVLFTNFKCKKGYEGGQDLRKECREYPYAYHLPMKGGARDAA